MLVLFSKIVKIPEPKRNKKIFSQNAGAWKGLKGPPGKKESFKISGEHVADTYRIPPASQKGTVMREEV